MQRQGVKDERRTPMYDSNSDGDFSQADIEPLPHERISEVWAVDFQRYFDRWISANRQRIVELFPTTHRRAFGCPVRQRIVAIAGGVRASPRSYGPYPATRCV